MAELYLRAMRRHRKRLAAAPDRVGFTKLQIRESAGAPARFR
jgi:hypothetical protein